MKARHQFQNGVPEMDTCLGVSGESISFSLFRALSAVDEKEQQRQRRRSNLKSANNNRKGRRKKKKRKKKKKNGNRRQNERPRKKERAKDEVPNKEKDIVNCWDVRKSALVEANYVPECQEGSQLFQNVQCYQVIN